tara:strand:+ start:1783 stop:2013 length:231 start_codon:yes stop_codon:yes gene_type:complete
MNKSIQQSSAYRARMSLLYEAVEDYLARIKFLIRFKKLEKRVEEIEALHGVKRIKMVNNNMHASSSSNEIVSTRTG